MVIGDYCGPFDAVISSVPTHFRSSPDGGVGSVGCVPRHGGGGVAPFILLQGKMSNSVNDCPKNWQT